MKKRLLFLAIIPILFIGCGKPDNVFDFTGTVVGYVDCTSSLTSISEMDFGYVVALSVPDSIGGDYEANGGKQYGNCVILYRTKARYHDGDNIEGSMYLDDKYSKAYCQFHHNFGIPEGVCYSLK